jgi:hypothetical protein
MPIMVLSIEQNEIEKTKKSSAKFRILFFEKKIRYLFIIEICINFEASNSDTFNKDYLYIIII